MSSDAMTTTVFLLKCAKCNGDNWNRAKTLEDDAILILGKLGSHLGEKLIPTFYKFWADVLSIENKFKT